jgi:xanthine dehydrogenase iron-sulfur cluster and FAD-binding subunit A
MPYRATAAEDSIKGKTINESNAETAAVAGVSAATPMSANGSNLAINGKFLLRRV